MLIAHKVIDVLEGRVSHPPLMDLPGITPESRGAMAKLLHLAEKFDFGELPLEPHENGTAFRLPQLTADEKEFWSLGLVPLPAPVCWYEFTLRGCRSELLVCEIDGGSAWRVERIDYLPYGILFDGIGVEIARAVAFHSGTLIEMSIVGNVPLYKRWEEAGMHAVTHGNIGANAPVAVYMTLMLNSRTTEAHAEAPPPALNKKRTRAGKTPLFSHRVVRIVPDRFVERGEGTGTHRSPRLHWRRSHLRHYDHHVPSAQWVPNAKHDGREGWWIAVIPRFLVGRAELGEVSHEYRVEHEEAA